MELQIPSPSPLLLLKLLLFLSGTMRRAMSTTFTLVNSCPYTVWPGISPDAGQPLLAAGGFSLASGQSNVLSPPAGWSGRVWARTGCSFDGNGRGICATGDCGGVLQCSGAGGQTPVSLAEFTLGAAASAAAAFSTHQLDFYDVSLVDGYNVPLLLTPSAGTGNCGAAGCTSNLNGKCPQQLQMAGDDGQVLACRSACDAFNTPQYCCTGAFNTPQTCSPSSYSQLFKTACPTAYSYAYDDPTSTFTCTNPADYKITFCPNGTS